MNKQSIRDVQNKILEIMKFIDNVCRENSIDYYIMGGTALGAVRHGGFIPWDDDLDIFMTPNNYKKFKKTFNKIKNKKFMLQEWKIVENYLEYAKVRMNGTTFIEPAFRGRKDLHHGIYVDIMILHKCPNNKLIQRVLFCASKFVTLVALSQRNWVPKNILHRSALLFLKILPRKLISKQCYKLIYKYDNRKSNFAYCYFITKANFRQSVFDRAIFDKSVDIQFEDTVLMAPANIEKYLRIRYGDYMQLPSKEEQRAAVHAEIYDTEEGYENYI